MFVPFEPEYREKYFDRLNRVFDSGFLSEGDQVREFEKKFGEFSGIPALAVCNGGAGLAAVYEYLQVAGKDVIVPANTFWATTVTAKRAGANVIYADCNRNDLCLSLEDLKQRVTENTRAVTVVHIGGHIAFEIERIAAFCRERDIALVEDCCHAHGASLHGQHAGSWGIAGVYSFYATKTMPLGEGGMVASKNPELLDWLAYQRNYGKHVVDGKVSYRLSSAMNYRMSEVVAALGNVQMERLPGILDWKRRLADKFDKIFEKRLVLPDGMLSGYYKYIVFDTDLKETSGQVFGVNDLGYNIDEASESGSLPNTEWIARHHSCVPIWYSWPGAGDSVSELGKALLG